MRKTIKTKKRANAVVCENHFFYVYKLGKWLLDSYSINMFVLYENIRNHKIFVIGIKCL